MPTIIPTRGASYIQLRIHPQEYEKDCDCCNARTRYYCKICSIRWIYKVRQDTWWWIQSRDFGQVGAFGV